MTWLFLVPLIALNKKLVTATMDKAGDVRVLLAEDGGNGGANQYGAKEFVDRGDGGGDVNVCACLVRWAMCSKETKKK